MRFFSGKITLRFTDFFNEYITENDLLSHHSLFLKEFSHV